MPKIVKLEKSIAEARLADTPEDKRFWAHNGQVYRNLEELRVGLAGMDEDTFRYHFNDAKNDFSSWVKDVIGDDKLANDLQKSNKSSLAAKRVAERIEFLKKRAAG